MEIKLSVSFLFESVYQISGRSSITQTVVSGSKIVGVILGSYFSKLYETTIFGQINFAFSLQFNEKSCNNFHQNCIKY